MKFIYPRDIEKMINEWESLRMNFLHTSIAEYCEKQILKIKQLAIPMILIQKEK